MGPLVVVGVAVFPAPNVGLGVGEREGSPVIGALEGICVVGALEGALGKGVGRFVGRGVVKGAKVCGNVGDADGFLLGELDEGEEEEGEEEVGEDDMGEDDMGEDEMGEDEVGLKVTLLVGDADVNGYPVGTEVVGACDVG